MGIDPLFNIVLAVIVLSVAFWVVFAKDAFSAVVGFVVYGLLLGLVWVRLSAIDVALTEAAIGGGVTGVLLLRAANRMRGQAVLPAGPGFATRVIVGLLCTAVTAGLASVVLFPVSPSPSLAQMSVDNLGPVNVGNPVTAVLLAFRAMDTLLEKVVLLVALIGVWSLAPEKLWGGKPAVLHGIGQGQSPAHGPLVFLARMLPPIGILIAIYMFWVGADEPGGAFQGGAVLAAMWILVMMAGIEDAPRTASKLLRLWLTLGSLVFLAVGLAGFFVADAFLAYPVAYAKALIIIIEATLVLSIAVTLGLLVAGTAERGQGQ